jgi:CHAT domain-containing protein
MEEWGLFEAKLLSETHSMDLIEHAAGCDACGPLLADLRQQDMADESVPLDLKTGTPQGKQEILRRISKMTAEEKPRRKLSWPNPVWLAAAAVLVIAIGSGLWWYRSNSPDAAFQLLAKAYSEQRPMEFRISGADYQPIRVQRGGNVTPPVSLIEANALIARKLQADPNSSLWLRAKARADLLSLSYSSAIENLRKAQETTPDDPEILGDLGIAYLQRSEKESRPSDLNQAVEFLTQAIRARPADTVFRYNRALAFEHLLTPRSAIDDWTEFLRVEPKGNWSNEAQEHLKRQQEMLLKQDKGASRPRRSEDAILALAERGFQSSEASDPAVIARRLLEDNHDPWMRDLLAADQRANLTLAAASRETASGNASTAQSLWVQAEHQFQRSGNQAGTLFAKLEESYTLQRLSKPVECLKNAKEMQPAVQRLGYQWIEVQLQLVLTACLSQAGSFDVAYAASVDAQRVAEKAGYETLVQQSLGRRASVLRSIGSYRESIRLDSDGLRRFWSTDGEIGRAYQFYYGLATAAGELSYPQTAAALMREAVELSAKMPNRPVEGMVRGRFGETLVKDGQAGEAEQQFTRSVAIFQTLKDSPSLQLYKSRAELSHARLDAQQGHVGAGLERLGHLESELPSIQNSVVEAELLGVKSELLTSAGRLDESNQSLRRVLELSATAPTAAAKAGDPSVLARQVSDAVRILVERLVARGDVAGALQLWMRYNPSYQTLDPPSSTDVRLTYVNLSGGLGVWIADGGSVHFERLPISAGNLLRYTGDFRRMLSSPETPVDSIQRLGKQLRAALLDPVQRWLPLAKTLEVSADGPVAAVPFGALVLEDGTWLADHYQAIYSPPLAGAHPAQKPRPLQGSRLLAVGAGEPATILEANLPSLPDLDQDLKFAGDAFPDHILLAGHTATRSALLENLPQAEVFHFSGHAIANASDAALVLSTSDALGLEDRTLWMGRLSSATLQEALQKCTLAVLAACSTGRGFDEDADPSSAMARAFLMAGVPEVVAARWDVDSKATGALVQEFYQKLGYGTVNDALSKAIQSLRGQAAFKHPYYWAAFDDFRL